MSGFGVEYSISENAYGGENPMGGGFVGADGGSGEVEKKPRDKQVILPVTIKQIKSMDGNADDLIIDGVEVNQVKIIGTIDKKEETQTRIVFTINDGTDTIDVNKYVSDQSPHDTQRLNACTENSLVTVYGSIKTANNVKTVNAFEILPIIDWNEMTHHYLSVIITHLYNTKGPIPGSAGANAPNKFGMGSGMGLGGGMSMMPNHGQNLNTAVQQNKGDDYYKQEILAVYGDCDNAAGLSFHSCFDALEKRKVSITMDQLESFVNQLADEGNLYSTIDESHYAKC
mmetsp:Transcript_31222/g.74008  ORF Transcript_31222/g.74008 Transcript_31222/m.74008 type:complete len:285 (+) Transcript_31222:27-881(+)